jgi:hypothetical protein
MQTYPGHSGYQNQILVLFMMAKGLMQNAKY